MALIQIERPSKHILLFKINRPEAANAFSNELLETFEAALNDLGEARVLIITGSGAKAFSAGADLKERKKLTEDEVWPAVARIRSLVQRVSELEIPTIAAINGVAFGGGLELALACDIRVAHVSAQLGLTETSLGVIPGAFGTVHLTRIVGEAAALEMILSAKRITAEEAKQIGLVTGVSDDALREATQIAEAISNNAPLAVKRAKEVVNAVSGNLTEAFLAEEKAYKSLIATEDRLEGLRAFSEKRAARFLGR
ncbi:enoyl-CoA hydratase-related protein [Listeria sp. ILCC792]|uniref:enoyl-CoA hydratase-related protein n=1 Tax=Listeria sp. ILCC792 TaxID=1918331 RepID=UPI000B5956BE|nr:enoyl-CoA hydratase-related protein [Listeria sp. ILCC792]